MNDGQKQTVNHVYHFLKDLLHKYEIGFYQCNGRKPDDTDLKSMIWYLETNFSKDILKHEMAVSSPDHPDHLCGSEPVESRQTYSEKMQDELEPLDDKA